MRDLSVTKRSGDHPDDLSPCVQGRVGNHTHEPDACAPVHEADAGRTEMVSDLSGGGLECGRRADARTAEDTDASHTRRWWRWHRRNVALRA